MDELQHISNGAGRELAPLMPRPDIALPAPLGSDTVRGGVKARIRRRPRILADGAAA